MWKTLIVDDEPLAIRGLRRLLSDCPLMVVGEAGSGREALDQVARLQPDLVFLDIQMPELSGLEVAEQLAHGEIQPLIVFVTAFDQHAVSAFSFHALDYVLKPIDPDRFAQAVARVLHLLETRQQAGFWQRFNTFLQEPRAPRSDRIAFAVEGEHVFVSPKDIRWLEASGNYVCLYVGEQTLIVRDTLQRVLERLAPWGFVQISRGKVVQQTLIKRIVPYGKGTVVITLQDGTDLVSGRRFQGNIQKLLN